MRTSNSNQSLLRSLTQPLDGDLMVFFRVVFGVFGFVWVVKQFRGGAIETLYVLPRYHFHFYGFEWVEPLSPAATRLEFYGLGIAAILIATGFCYRLAALAFALMFTHLFFVDKCLYQNHYYLICVLSWVMCVMPSTGWTSIPSTTPRWALWLLRYQLALPYVFGSVAKWNGDWIAGEPIRSMLLQRSSLPIVGAWFTLPGAVGFFVWGGLLFDLLVVPGLLSRRFRWVACGFAVFFHLTNACLFTIGIFPWFMLASLPVFFPPGCLRRWSAQARDVLRATMFHQWPDTNANAAAMEGRAIAAPNDETSGRFVFEQLGGPVRPYSRNLSTYLAAFFIGLFVLAQAIMPLRHYAIPGNVHWTEEGHCFSWHMLVRGKRCALRIMATDGKTGRTGSIDLRPYVTAFQLPRVARDPRLIFQLVHHIEHDLRVKGFDEVELRAICLVSLNGRKPQHLIRPTVDLTEATAGFTQPDWIMPLVEPLRNPPWDEPLSKWEEHVPPPD